MTYGEKGEKKQGKENKLEDSAKDQSFDPFILISSISFRGFLSRVSSIDATYFLLEVRRKETYGGDTLSAKSLEQTFFIIKINYQ